VLAGWFSFSPAIRGLWLWDDRAEIPDNGTLRDLPGLAQIWLTPPGPDYYPLKSTVQWLLWHIWGGDAAAYHVANICLHIIAALLFWRLLATFRVRLAWLGGLLFVVHPLTVESVAWITELKNTLSLPFLLVAMLAYTGFCDSQEDEGAASRSRRCYFLSLLSFLAAMLCKSSVVMFPVVILLYVQWRRGRVRKSDLVASAPFFAIAFILGVVTLWFQIKVAIGATDIPIGGPGLRLARAGMAIAFYLSKCLFPVGLLPVYPRWPIGPYAFWEIASPLALALIVAWLWISHSRRPAPWWRHVRFGLGCFLVTLAPVLGLLPMSYLRLSSVADHLAYVPLLGLIGLAVAGFGALPGWNSRDWRRIASVAAAVLVAFAFSSRNHSKIFQSEEKLWTFAVQHNPRSAFAADYLGVALASDGRIREATGWFHKAVEIDPGFAEAHNDLGRALEENGRRPDAIVEYEWAVRIKPDFALAWDNLGLALVQTDSLTNAEASFRRALQIKSDFADAHNHLGIVLARENHLPEAIAEYRQAIYLNSNNAEAFDNLGLALVKTGRLDDAVSAEQHALALDRNFAEAQNNLGGALWSGGKRSEAIEHYRLALRLKPNYPEAENNLGYALAQLGRRDEAIAHYQVALRLKPVFAEAENNLANEYLGAGRLSEAIVLYRQALTLKPDLVSTHNNLGVALQEAGLLREAVAEYNEALRLNPNDARSHLDLGMALAAIGMPQEAQAQFARAAALDPSLASGPGFPPKQ
jgi:protein O-mannosyl-transferase